MLQNISSAGIHIHTYIFIIFIHICIWCCRLLGWVMFFYWDIWNRKKISISEMKISGHLVVAKCLLAQRLHIYSFYLFVFRLSSILENCPNIMKCKPYWLYFQFIKAIYFSLVNIIFTTFMQNEKSPTLRNLISNHL